VFNGAELPASDDNGLLDPYLKVGFKDCRATESKRHHETRDPLFLQTYTHRERERELKIIHLFFMIANTSFRFSPSNKIQPSNHITPTVHPFFLSFFRFDFPATLSDDLSVAPPVCLHLYDDDWGPDPDDFCGIAFVPLQVMNTKLLC